MRAPRVVSKLLKEKEVERRSAECVMRMENISVSPATGHMYIEAERLSLNSQRN